MFQEVCAQYNHYKVVPETNWIILVQPILAVLQLSEWLLYVYLFAYEAKHDKEIEENNLYH